MVVRYSWVRKDFDYLQKRLSQEGFIVEPKIEGYVDQNGNIITKTTELTAYSDNYKWVAGYRKGELFPRVVKEIVKITPRDEKFFRLYRNEHRHSLSRGDVGMFILLGGVVTAVSGLLFEIYLYYSQVQHALGH